MGQYLPNEAIDFESALPLKADVCRQGDKLKRLHARMCEFAATVFAFDTVKNNTR
jgi:hypothetical protein